MMGRQLGVRHAWKADSRRDADDMSAEALQLVTIELSSFDP